MTEIHSVADGIIKVVTVRTQQARIIQSRNPEDMNSSDSGQPTAGRVSTVDQQRYISSSIRISISVPVGALKEIDDGDTHFVVAVWRQPSSYVTALLTIARDLNINYLTRRRHSPDYELSSHQISCIHYLNLVTKVEV